MENIIQLQILKFINTIWVKYQCGFWSESHVLIPSLYFSGVQLHDTN